MFADPITVTINSVAHVMPRIEIGAQKAVYQTADGLYKLTISHQKSGTRTRSMARLDVKKVVTNPLDSTNDYDYFSFYSVIDRPEFGFSMVEAEQITAGHQAWQTAGVVDKLYGIES